MRIRLIAVLVLLGATGAVAQAQRGNPVSTPRPAVPPILKLAAADFVMAAALPKKYSCQDDRLAAGVSPQLQWTNVPKGTASFVVFMHGPDNHPAKGTMDDVLWVVWNLPANATQLPEGVTPNAQLPDGSRQVKVRGDVTGYRAPCPPPGSGPHHYVFEIYAIDQKLDLAPQASREDVMKAVDGHIIGASALSAFLSRSRTRSLPLNIQPDIV